MPIPKVVCMQCDAEAHPLAWRCEECAGPLDLAEYPAFDADAIDPADFSLWRYGAMLPVARHLSLGEGMTPLVHTTIDEMSLYAKLEYLNPTGSYKDRGTVTMMNHIYSYEVKEVVEDSSGNAGASVAAYANAMGIHARIFVPETGSPSKKALIRAFGGELVEIAGPQHAKTDACRQAAKTTTYASHAWSPFFVLGQMTAAYEVWEQMGQRAPDAIATPLGHGGLFLGFARGFLALYHAGLIDTMPRMIAVQAANSDPIVRGWQTGLETPPIIETQPTIADGIIVNEPVRGKEVLAAIRSTQGLALRVTETEIAQAHDKLHQRGFMAEPTSAVTIAALPQIRAHIGDEATLVCALTGNGLKYLSGN